MDACWPVKSEPGHVMNELTRECEERGIWNAHYRRKPARCRSDSFSSRDREV